MGIVFGLTTALCWGAGDFVARYSARAIGPLKTVLFMQFFGFLAMTAYVIPSGDLARMARDATLEQLAWGLLVGVLNTFSGLALFRAFQIGAVSVVAPVAASYGALTALLAFLSGETLSTIHVAGIVVTVVGVILAAMHLVHAPDEAQEQPLTRGIGWALVAAVCLGTTFWLLGFKVTPELGGVMPVWIVRLTSILVLGPALLLIPRERALPRGRVWGWLVFIGVIDTVGFIANTLGLLTDQVSIVTVLASLFTAVTVVLAWIFLREPLTRLQWLGVVVIFAGIALVSI